MRRPSVVILLGLLTPFLLGACPGSASPIGSPDAWVKPLPDGVADASKRDAKAALTDALAADGAVVSDAAGPEAGLPPVCTPGSAETDACGACATGSRSRSCGAQGQWGAWSVCAGAQTGFPFDPSTLATICPPYVWPAVFFAPHADDESISMAGAIAEHVTAGRQVFVELMTRGEASGVINTLNNGGTCAWHSGSHVYPLTPLTFGDARVKEFLQATASLGVRGVFLSDFGDGNLTANEVKQRIAFWQAHQDPAKATSYKGSVGTTQSGAGGANHPDHIAVWTALTTSGLSDVRGYAADLYTPSSGKPLVTKTLTSNCAAKAVALGAYKTWSPAAGRYAVGYHSVKAMIDTAVSSCQEYVLNFTP